MQLNYLYTFKTICNFFFKLHTSLIKRKTMEAYEFVRKKLCVSQVNTLRDYINKVDIDLLLTLMKEYATIKSQEAFEHGKNVGHANAIGDSIYGSGFENKDINFDEWL